MGRKQNINIVDVTELSFEAVFVLFLDITLLFGRASDYRNIWN